jgi:hypothetical protein
MVDGLIGTGMHVSVTLSTEPRGLALLELAEASGVADPEAVVTLIEAKRGRNMVDFRWLTPVPCVYRVDSGLSLLAWESDYAFTSAVRAVMPAGAGFALFGGPLGLGLAIECGDGIVMVRRSANLAWAAGRLRLAAEGVTMADLDGMGMERTLSAEAVARRLCAEELGPAMDDAVMLPIGLSTRAGQVVVLVRAVAECGFDELTESAELAPDGYEGTMVCFGSHGEALAAMGGDVDNASARALAALVGTA